jgi:hypothetical protein
MTTTIDPASIDPSRYVFTPGVSEFGDIDLDEVVIHDAVTGLRVTEADLDRETAELERQYPGLAPGGKSLSGDGSHSPRFQVVLGCDVAEKVRERAAEAHMSVSKYLRRIIERDIAA